jgi:hypothetical protein
MWAAQHTFIGPVAVNIGDDMGFPDAATPARWRIYLANALGTTPQRVRKDFGTAFAGRRGIVAFKVDGWQTATGHIALWNGTQFREDDHDDYRQQRDDPTTVQNEGTTVEMLLWPL